jgi:polyisoprenoid-binding protein YceI
MDTQTQQTATIPIVTRTTWVIDPAHSNAQFAVKHLLISTVRGRFGRVTGTITLDEQHLANSRVDVEIDTASIDTREEQRDTHLRSADFLDVEHFPTITFRSSHVEPGRGDAFRVVGDLTIRGVTRHVVLDAKRTGRGTSPWGGEVIGFEATTKINRQDFGLTWNVALEAGGVLVGDEIKITIDVEATHQNER